MVKKNAVEEPEYIISPINTRLLNYKVYKMSAKEKLLYALIGFVAGGLIGLLFYGGLFKGDNGAATRATYISNVIVFSLAGVIADKIFIPLMKKSLQTKRLSKLKIQFRDFLSAMSNSMSSGMNVNESLIAAREDLTIQYSEEAYIVVEVVEMINGIQNNIPIEDTIKNFGERSGIDDISNFGIVFSVCYRTGGNLKDIIRRSTDIISEKMIIMEEIETKITSNKMQMKVMMIIPIVMMALLKTMSSEFAESYSTVIGVICITVSMGFFVGAYILGNKIMNIQGD